MATEGKMTVDGLAEIRRQWLSGEAKPSDIERVFSMASWALALCDELDLKRMQTETRVDVLERTIDFAKLELSRTKKRLRNAQARITAVRTALG